MDSLKIKYYHITTKTIIKIEYKWKRLQDEELLVITCTYGLHVCAAARESEHSDRMSGKKSTRFINIEKKTPQKTGKCRVRHDEITFCSFV